jgi:hypothetical protein
MPEIPGRGAIESLRRMWLSEHLLISDSAGDTHWVGIRVVESIHISLLRVGACKGAGRNECPRNDTLEK